MGATAFFEEEFFSIKIIFFILAIFFLINIFFGKKIRKRSRSKEINYAQKLIGRGGAYVAKDKFMTATEQNVFHMLMKAYGEKYHIFCQVRVVDVVEPNSKKYKKFTKEYKSLFWQVSQWHFDYVLCEKESFNISYVLELDDPSHNKPERIRRDRILNSVCKDSGIQLKRMWLDYENKKIKVVDNV